MVLTRAAHAADFEPLDVGVPISDKKISLWNGG
jgi:hypothetical protein